MNDNLFFMNNQIINISQYSNMSIPLAKRIHFNVYGIKELSEKKVLPHPISFFLTSLEQVFHMILIAT